METTFEILASLVPQIETLSSLVVTLINTHISDQDTIARVTAEAEAVKEQATAAIVQASQVTDEANAIKAADAQEADLASRFSTAVDQLIAQASAALPPTQPPVPPVV